MPILGEIVMQVKNKRLVKFAGRLKIIRKTYGLNQHQFAAYLGITRAKVESWESQRNEPNIDDLLLISRTFIVSIDSLLK